MSLVRTRNADVATAPQGRKRPKNRKCRWGRRKSLKRLDSAKEMEEINLDFLPEKLGFPSENLWISFRADLDFLHRAGAPPAAAHPFASRP
jgi:hypothetical protein